MRDLDTQGKPMDQTERQAGDDQIGVITLMRLMWKWKMIILGGILVGALVAFTISVLMPHVYEVDMLVENVQIGTDKAGDKAYLGNLQNLSNQIGAGAFNHDILGSLREQYKDALPRRISFKVSLTGKNQFAKIAYEAVDVEMADKILSQLFKRLQEACLVRVEHGTKEIDTKIEEKKAQIEKKKEEIALKKKTVLLMKQEMLDEIKVDRRDEEDLIKRSKKRIKNLILKRKSDMNARKCKDEAMLKYLGKRDAEVKSSIKIIESGIDFLIKTRGDFLSKSNEIRNMDVAGELSSQIMAGYTKLNELRQERVFIDSQISDAKLSIQEIDDGLKKLANGTEVTPGEIQILNDSIRRSKRGIEELDLQAKELSDELAASTSTEKPNSDLGNSIVKEKGQMDLLLAEVGTLEASMKNVKNIVLLQPPTSGVSPLTPNTRRNGIIGAVVGLFLSLFLAVFLEYVYKKDGGRGELNR